ncbi:MBL fold metallo-hydrolase [Syntrophobacter fumaroxidans]|uniref:Beta-lactamase domain protein n=1 Tax=Syntrophobacter fumaroxidans (strain DSM 10017 / MPOB) TaxID=335543 RepID=A0LIU1_SYNFM|nr:ribonuclease Z [Syntrophobacter fumaroxidans]ABK17343.1 beta-lactamase domain protein [Syntrophobacter fumaroxidans MPOB]
MKITFLGVGEACDAILPNTSLWIETGTGGRRCSVMLDCGFTVPPRYWLQTENPDDLDALWVSHFHGDHFFGTPALLLRFWETRRTKPLVVIGQPGIEQLIRSSMDLAYPNFLPKLTYPLEFHTAIPGETMHAAGLDWNFAESGHGQRNLSVRVDDGSEAIFYSGDGLPSVDTLELARGCALVVHEAFRLDQPTPGHGTVSECIGFARQAGVRRLALVHFQRDERKTKWPAILNLVQKAQDLEAIVPEPGAVMEL